MDFALITTKPQPFLTTVFLVLLRGGKLKMKFSPILKTKIEN